MVPVRPRSPARGLVAKGTEILLWRMHSNVIVWEGWSTKGSTLGQSQIFGHTALLPLNTYKNDRVSRLLVLSIWLYLTCHHYFRPQ